MPKILPGSFNTMEPLLTPRPMTTLLVCVNWIYNS